MRESLSTTVLTESSICITLAPLYGSLNIIKPAIIFTETGEPFNLSIALPHAAFVKPCPLKFSLP